MSVNQGTASARGGWKRRVEAKPFRVHTAGETEWCGATQTIARWPQPSSVLPEEIFEADYASWRELRADVGRLRSAVGHPKIRCPQADGILRRVALEVDGPALGDRRPGVEAPYQLAIPARATERNFDEEPAVVGCCAPRSIVARGESRNFRARAQTSGRGRG
jgi:hypothetical protein